MACGVTEIAGDDERQHAGPYDRRERRSQRRRDDAGSEACQGDERKRANAGFALARGFGALLPAALDAKQKADHEGCKEPWVEVLHVHGC